MKQLIIRTISSIVLLTIGVAIIGSSPQAFPRWVGLLVIIMLFEVFCMHRSAAQAQRSTPVKRWLVSLSLASYCILGLGSFMALWYEMSWLLVIGMVAVIGSDVGGYVIGKIVKGKKLIPSISPNKTWSGTIGGWIVAAAGVELWYYLACGPLDTAYIIATIVQGVFLSILTQTGDLLVSAAKRFYGVKDTGSIIPGHGGLLDRFDGMLLVMTMLALQFIVKLPVLYVRIPGISL